MRTKGATMKSLIRWAWVAGLILLCGCNRVQQTPTWEAANPTQPLPAIPLGLEHTFADLEQPPTPERVRLGRWLFYDTRLSADSTISCATCHRPENAFSEPTPVSTGIDGQMGGRKSPSFVNQAWTLYPHFFWDGRAASLEEQAVGPVENPIEMGNTHDAMLSTLWGVEGYAPYFEEAFGTPEITLDRVAKALADYERTRLSGNSAWDKWRHGQNDSAVSDRVKQGHELFFDKAGCSQCHFGENFTDSRFHNLGIGWDAEAKKYSDEGRFIVSKDSVEMGAFKTPGLRETTKHAPYMHDGSLLTLRDVVVHYNIGGTANPFLSPMIEPLDLTDEEIDAVVAFMEALDGEGYQDVAPESFPK